MSQDLARWSSCRCEPIGILRSAQTSSTSTQNQGPGCATVELARAAMVVVEGETHLASDFELLAFDEKEERTLTLNSP